MVVFLAQELEATHSALSPTALGSPGRSDTQTALCSWSCSLACKEREAAQGWEGRPGSGCRACKGSAQHLGGCRSLLTMPWTLHTAAEGAPRLHRTDSAIEFSFTHIFFSLDAIHGALREGRAGMRAGTLPTRHPLPRQSALGQQVISGLQRA